MMPEVEGKERKKEDLGRLKFTRERRPSKKERQKLWKK